MEQKKAFPIRYIAGGFLLLASILLLLEDEYFIFYLSFFCLVGAALCFLPPNRMGLWIGGAAVIVLHFLAQQLRPGMLLVLLRDPPGGMEGDPLYFSTGFGAFVCFVYVCAPAPSSGVSAGPGPGSRNPFPPPAARTSAGPHQSHPCPE